MPDNQSTSTLAATRCSLCGLWLDVALASLCPRPFAPSSPPRTPRPLALPPGPQPGVSVSSLVQVGERWAGSEGHRPRPAGGCLALRPPPHGIRDNAAARRAAGRGGEARRAPRPPGHLLARHARLVAVSLELSLRSWTSGPQEGRDLGRPGGAEGVDPAACSSCGDASHGRGGRQARPSQAA